MGDIFVVVSHNALHRFSFELLQVLDNTQVPNLNIKNVADYFLDLEECKGPT